MKNNFIDQLIKLAKGKIGAIKRGELTPENSGIGIIINRIKGYDQAAYEDCLRQYIKLVR
jgi:hypothetical protein